MTADRNEDGFNGEKWWDCPDCGGDTDVNENTRKCTQCDWSYTIPMQADRVSEESDGLSDPLEDRGFREVETAIPGDWASNVQLSIQITSKRDVDRRRAYVARVYDSPADSLELPRVQLLAEAQAGDHVEATRRALEGADDNNEDPWLILDCDDEVVDTAKSGSEAMQKKEEIEKRVPWGSPYEIESS